MSKYENMTDRELDGVVAEKVMGEHGEVVWGASPEDEPDAYFCWTDAKKWHSTFPTKASIEQWISEHPVIHGKKTVLRSHVHHKPYSTDIAAAWQVVERLIGDRKLECSTLYGLSPPQAEFFDSDTGVMVSFASAPTMPRAICIAALLAMDNQTAEGSAK